MEYKTGKTLGKIITETKVVCKNGESLPFLNVLSRTFMHFIKIDVASFIYGTGIDFHDVLSGTLVVKINHTD